jgi:hypothetical protein
VVNDRLPMIEVAFNPHGGAEEWPHFTASAEDPRGTYLYELLAEGWRLTAFFGCSGDIKVGAGEAHPDVEDALWRGAACLTGTPEIEAVTVPIIPGGVLTQPEGDHRA